MKFQDDISNMNTYVRTYIHTYGQAETNMPPPPSLFQSWGHNEAHKIGHFENQYEGTDQTTFDIILFNIRI